MGGEGEEKMEERHVLYLKRHQLQDGEGWVERKGVGERERKKELTEERTGEGREGMGDKE